MSVVGPPTHIVRCEGAKAVNIGKFYYIDEVAELLGISTYSAPRN